MSVLAAVQAATNDEVAHLKRKLLTSVYENNTLKSAHWRAQQSIDSMPGIRASEWEAGCFVCPRAGSRASYAFGLHPQPTPVTPLLPRSNSALSRKCPSNVPRGSLGAPIHFKNHTFHTSETQVLFRMVLGSASRVGSRSGCVTYGIPLNYTIPYPGIPYPSHRCTDAVHDAYLYCT